MLRYARHCLASAFLSATVCLAIAPGCERKPAAPPPPTSTSPSVNGEPQQLLALRTAQLPICYSALSFLAESRGLCKAAGVDYSSVAVPAGPDVVTALRSQSTDAAVLGTIAITPVATMVGAGDQPVIVATMMMSQRQAKLVTFDATAITDNPSSLRGKRVGVTRNTNGDIYLSRLLAKGGLTERDITVISGRPADLRASLVRGDLDAAVLWDPFVVQAKREYDRMKAQAKIPDRGNAVILVDPTLHTLTFDIVSTKSKLDLHRPAVVRFLRALIAAEADYQRDPASAQASVEQWLGLDAGDLSDFFTTSQLHVHLDVPSGQQWLHDELLWLQARDPNVKIPGDLSAYFDASLLHEIDASRVVQGK